MITLADMRQQVRDTTEDNGFGDEVLNGWIRRGHGIIQMRANWPWHYRDVGIEVSSSNDPTDFTVIPLCRQILSVASLQHGPLREIQWETAKRQYFRSGSSGGSRPTEYTILEHSPEDPNDSPAVKLRLWPKTSTAAQTVLVSYLAEPPLWPSFTPNDTDIPALAANFHDMLIMYATNEAYNAIGDTDLAARHYSAFKQQLEHMRQQYLSVTSGSDMKIGTDGGNNVFA